MTDPKNPQQPRPPPCEVGRVAEGEWGRGGRNLFRKNPENFYKIFYGLRRGLGCSGFRKHKGSPGSSKSEGGTGTQVL